MRNVAVASDLVRRVDDDDALAKLVGEQPRALAEHGRLADAGSTEQQDALAGDDDVANDLAGAGDCAACAHGQPDDAPRPVADRGDAMQRALDAGAVVVAELADVVGDVLQVGGRNGMVCEQYLASRHASLGLAAQVEDDLEQLARVDALVQGPCQVRRQRTREQLDFLIPVRGTRRLRLTGLRAHPNEGTSPFSRTGFGTRTASSLTSNNCVSNTLNPRPRRASIMCES